MDTSSSLSHFPWLPFSGNFKEKLDNFTSIKTTAEKIHCLRGLANSQLDFLQHMQLDNRLAGLKLSDKDLKNFRRVKLALLASSTADHLIPSLRVAALRRGIWLDCFLAPFGQIRQQVLVPSSELYGFKPDVILFAMDAQDLGSRPASAAMDELLSLWKAVRQNKDVAILQQTWVVPPETLFGQQDRVIPSAPSFALREMNRQLALLAAENNIQLLDVDHIASCVGKNQWCDQPLWFHAKQSVSPLFAPLYGDYVARLLASIYGLSYKVLAVDLDNTLWGGVIGDDGLEGIEVGQGSGLGEAFVHFQQYLKQLKQRGVLLAICSKNDEANALLPFESHPGMILKKEDFSVIVANWVDKATNLEQIAAKLKLGLDSIVFFDDNPVERALIREQLPQVAVPETPEDPAEFTRCLAAAGYFEAVSFTAEDQGRAAQYQSNVLREDLQAKSRDLDDYLRNLKMEMVCAPFDDVGLQRITQLVNKSNQFNLTTRRYTQAQIQSFQNDKKILTFQFHLKDCFSDSGMISVVIGRPLELNKERALLIDTWLMSCRVLGRQVEEEVLNQIANRAKESGYAVLRGEYIPTSKNQMVENHYKKMGFKSVAVAAADGRTQWELELRDFKSIKTQINVKIAARSHHA